MTSNIKADSIASELMQILKQIIYFLKTAPLRQLKLVIDLHKSYQIT